MSLAIIIPLVILLVLSSFLYILWFQKTLKKLKKEDKELHIAILSKQQDISNYAQEKRKKELEIKEIENTLEIQKGERARLDSENAVEKAHLENSREKLEELNQIFKQSENQIEITKQRNSEILHQIDNDFQHELARLQETYTEKAEDYEQQLADLRTKRNAAIEQAIKEFEEKNKKGFYMLQLTDEQLNNIYLLKQLEGRLNNKEVIGKILYKVYYEKAYTDLIGRVLDKKDFSGIYKITNQINQMCYIGQAASIKKRWQQHIKRAIGAEPLTNNKLYPAMREFGVENFTFEVVDRCDKAQLNEREKYWTEYYKAQEFGYSIRKG